MKLFRSYSFGVFLAIAVGLGSMIVFHVTTVREAEHRVAELEPLHQRRIVLDSMTLALERYRRSSGQFHKSSNEEIARAKELIRTKIGDGLTELAQLSPTPAERTSAGEVGALFSELLKQSAIAEPQLFLHDAYFKPEIQALHASILKDLDRLGASARTRIEAMAGAPTSGAEPGARTMALGSLLILFLLVSLEIKNYYAQTRPLRKLRALAESLRESPGADTSISLSGIHGEIAQALQQLAQTVEAYRRDRHKFIQDVVADLRSPLSLLQAGRALSARAAEGRGEPAPSEAEQEMAAESVRRGLRLLSGSLDDLSDVVEINRLEAKLEESVIDVSELVTDVAGGVAAAAGLVSISVPPMPIWARVDARRLERAVILVLTRVAPTLPRGNRLQLSVRVPSDGSRGVEISFQDAERLANGRARGAGTIATATGPEQDLLRHWIAETGLGMNLVHKIAKAHGGSVTAAGVAGTSVLVRFRLPQSRIVEGGLIAPPLEPSAQESPAPAGLSVKPLRAASPTAPVTDDAQVSTRDSGL